MTDPLKALLEAGEINTTLFAPTSRYYTIDTATYETSDKTTVVHLRRRFIPSPEEYIQQQEHTIVQNDRLDNLSNQYLGDPEQYWQLCDANGAIKPDEITENIGGKLRITLPKGIPG
jgi:nucleoid-associated protein YgaU